MHANVSNFKNGIFDLIHLWVELYRLNVDLRIEPGQWKLIKTRRNDGLKYENLTSAVSSVTGGDEYRWFLNIFLF